MNKNLESIKSEIKVNAILMAYTFSEYEAAKDGTPEKEELYKKYGSYVKELYKVVDAL